jgi:hypothetical protein
LRVERRNEEDIDMKPTAMKCIVAALACAGTAAQAASIQIHKQPDFTGASVTLNAASQDLKSINFHDQASSLVLDGTWEVCTQPKFNGHCETLQPGRYAKLEQSLNHRIESVRPVADAKSARGDRRDYAQNDEPRHGWVPEEKRGDDRRGEWRGRPSVGSIDIYPGADFHGRPMRLDRDVETLERASGEASSLVIHEGTWQLCTQAFYEGYCRTFEPGRYASLGRLDNRIASAKQIR